MNGSISGRKNREKNAYRYAMRQIKRMMILALIK
jgi:hypothetical protein